jgi:hypothetical protein
MRSRPAWLRTSSCFSLDGGRDAHATGGPSVDEIRETTAVALLEETSAGLVPSAGASGFWGPTTLSGQVVSGLAIRACQAGHRVQFATASQWVDRLAEAHHAGKLQDELRRLVRYPVLVIDEVGYIPFEPEAANLFFQLVSSRYERASLIVTSNKNFAR